MAELARDLPTDDAAALPTRPVANGLSLRPVENAAQRRAGEWNVVDAALALDFLNPTSSAAAH